MTVTQALITRGRVARYFSLAVLGFVVFLVSCRLRATSVTHIHVAGLDVAVWKPETSPPAAGFPVVVFSHGFTGCNTQSRFLMEALARAGYLALAPNHEDARCGSARTGEGHPGNLGDMVPEQRFQRPEEWTEATYQKRGKDIESLLDAMLGGTLLPGTPVDAKRIGLAGHSLGGYTVLGLAGAWPSWKDRRIKAVLALSPFCSPYVAKGDLGHMNVPVMYQGGTRDFGITPTVRRFQGAYDRSSAPKYYVEWNGAGHLAWTDLNHTYQGIINDYSVAFFDRFLKGKDDPDPLVALTANPLPGQISYLKSAAK
jgi:predicted dienelactone hydrolase